MSEPLVICYHALSEQWPADLCVHPQAFEEQLSHLVSKGYRGARFTDAVSSVPKGKTVVVTFDDAFRSVLDLAFPILERLGLPATVFAVSEFPREDHARPLSWPGIDHWEEGPHAHELASLSWSDLRELADAGWEVGSHTRTHPRLPELAQGALQDELRASRAACEEGMGHPCTSIAYPYGSVSPTVVDAAREAGYLAGAALPPSWHEPAPLEWPRIGVYWNDDLRRFRLKASPLVRQVRRFTGR